MRGWTRALDLQEVLMVYGEVSLQAAGAVDAGRPHPLYTVSADEKPGVHALGLTAPDLPPRPGETPAIGRDCEYIRHGAVSILAGIDLHSVHMSKETMAYLGTRPGRFQYMPTPKHGSWLNASPVMLRWNKFDLGVA